MKEGDDYQLLDDLGDIPANVWGVAEIGMMITHACLVVSSWTNLFECDRLRLYSVPDGNRDLFGNCTVGIDLVGLQEHSPHQRPR